MFSLEEFKDVSKPTMRFTLKIISFVRDGLHLNHQHREYSVSGKLFACNIYRLCIQLMYNASLKSLRMATVKCVLTGKRK
jgi:hypothetical protein